MIPVDVIDYGAGNLASVVKALRSAGGDPRVVTTPDTLSAPAIVVPGVGHFSATRSLGDPWRHALRTRLERGAALLGICLGMQWLFDGSDEEPDLRGFGAFRGMCQALIASDAIKVPHVGWNSLELSSGQSRLLDGIAPGSHAYFTHTYAAPVGDGCVALTSHGRRFASVVERGKVFGAQWHPEKSGDVGLQVLRNFLAAAGSEASC